jgi:undecaprenyl-diphosphatase
MPTAMIQLHNRIKNKKLKKCAEILIIAFIIFMVTSRLISGVHWLSDIIGGIFLSTGLVSMYYFLYKTKKDL